MFIIETDSEEELHEILEDLPLSEVAEARVTPLQSFEELRRDYIKGRAALISAPTH